MASSTQTIVFEDRVVAFVDVLGFKSMALEATSNYLARNKLENLVNLLSSSIPFFDTNVSSSVPARLIPRHNYVSDSIILSAPFHDSEMKFYSGLEVIVMRVIQLTHHLLNEGYLVRGGIAVGKVWHTQSNIVGPAYQEAFALEHKGCAPCVVLSPSAEAMWTSIMRQQNEIFPDTPNRMCIRRKVLNKSRLSFREKEKFIVNGLHDSYIPNATSPGALEQRYKHYRKVVDANLRKQHSPEIKRKWRWFDSYLSKESQMATHWAQ
ncbi:hypothetical protein [Dyella sp. C11]|uniref:hypothetical protein n=1 Tax=Dyella sp. C11 TaxID=2126991 RepID=UPI000D653C83|nr:hypothetical protein [Dyella sp. C11]